MSLSPAPVRALRLERLVPRLELRVEVFRLLTWLPPLTSHVGRLITAEPTQIITVLLLGVKREAQS
jgi:hypothetical protein